MTTCKAVLGCVLLPFSLVACEAPAQAEARGYPASPGDLGAYVAPVYGCVPDAFKVISQNNDSSNGDGLYVVWNPATGAFAESTSHVPCAERVATCRQPVTCDELLDWPHAVCVGAWTLIGTLAGYGVAAGCTAATEGAGAQPCAHLGLAVAAGVSGVAGDIVCNPSATIDGDGRRNGADGTGGTSTPSPSATVVFGPPVDIPVTPSPEPLVSYASPEGPACWPDTPDQPDQPPEEDDE